jgi:putative endonuclease
VGSGARMGPDCGRCDRQSRRRFHRPARRYASRPHAALAPGGQRPASAALAVEVVRVNAKDVLGQQGEQIAASFLADAGLVILERNWRCKEGEIDIVAVEGKTLVICEVKTRSGLRFGTPIEVITRQKAWRLRKLAVLWVNAHDVIFEEIRIDIVGVLRAVSGEFTIEHVPGVG